MRIACMMMILSGATAFGCGWDKSLDEFPKRAGEADDTARIQRAVDSVGAGVLYIPRGTYRVSSTIFIRNRCSLQMHKSATLRAVRKMDYVIYIDPRSAWNALKPRAQIDYNMRVCGGIIDADGLGACMGMDHCQHFTLRDTSFVNGSPCGLRIAPAGGICYEIIADNLYFACTKSGLAGNSAVWATTGDCHFTDCISVDYTVGFRMGRGGSNRLTRCHVWGGLLPPARPGEDREMLKDSICFWIDGASDTILRDCYADTGKTGFLVNGPDTHLTGCRYWNNFSGFKLGNITVIDHRSGRLLVTECRFANTAPGSRVYSGCGYVEWRDMIYSGFSPKTDQPGALDFMPEQVCATADDWEFLPLGTYAFEAKPNEFASANSHRGGGIDVPQRKLAKRFPHAGPGKDLVVKARATHPDTKLVEIALIHDSGKSWGTNIRLTQEWRIIRIPLSKLDYFKHWGTGPLEPGDRPDARHLTSIHFEFGNFLCDKTADRAHGYEIASIHITGR